MIVKRFREHSIDNRVLIVKQFSKDFQLWDFETINLLTVQNPAIKTYNDGVSIFESVNELNEFFFLTQSFK